MRQVQAERIGVGTTFARSGLDVIGNVYFQGNVGIGTMMASNEEVRLEGNLLSYSMALSNLNNVNRPTVSVFQENTNVPFFQAYGKDGLECQIDGEGNMDIYGDHLQIGEDRSPAFPLHAPIGMENLYTWSGNIPIVNGQEPLVRYFTPGYSNFDRVKIFGTTQMYTTYYTSQWANNQYALRFYLTTYESTPGTVTTPTNYIQVSMPVKPGVSHAFFLRTVSYERWSAPTVYVTNQNRTSFYRLQTQTNSYNSSTQPNSIWISPYLETSASHTYFEWLMYSIPKYVIDQYAFDEYYDDKSRYRKNIHICIIQGSYKHDDYLQCEPTPMELRFMVRCHFIGR
jgi:hypothetical protein